MLVLSRKKSEQIVIGDDITVTVVEVRGDKVRLGIDAPRNVAIHRKELLLQILAEQEAINRDVSEPPLQTGLGAVIDAQRNPPSDQFPHYMITEDRRDAG